MAQQGHQWRTNQQQQQQHIQDLHFPLNVDIQSSHPTTKEDYSPAITLTLAQSSNPAHSYPFGLDDLSTSIPHVLDDESMDLSTSADHTLIPNDASRFKRLFEGGPWNPQSITSHPATNTSYPTAPRFITNKSTIIRHGGIFHPSYRLAPASNPEDHTDATNPPRSFFGLHGLRATKSVMSGTEIYDVPTDDASGLGDLTEAATGINLNASQYGTLNYAYHQSFDTHTEPDLLSPQSKKSFKDVSSTASQGGSERKKRTHFCTVFGCENRKGFGSSNDLERHKKSVHHIAPAHGRDRSWRCIVEGCKSATKVWPRLDNFKNHCRNCHKDEDIDELLKKSEIKKDEMSVKNAVESVDPAGAANPADNTSLAATLIKDQASSSASYKGKSRDTISGAELARLSNDYSTSSFNDKMTLSLHNGTRPSTAKTGTLDDFLMPASFLPQDHAGEDDGNGFQLIPETPNHSYYSVSNVGLEYFSSNLLDELTRTLNLDQSSKAKVQELISISVYRLLNPDQESSIDSPDTTSTAVLAESANTSDKKIHCKHPGCQKIFDRPCELKKHFKRHSKPHFCTWVDCTSKKMFGSKADWVRHERTLHYKHLNYHCQEVPPGSGDDDCDKILIGWESFAMHLENDHGYTNQYEINDKLGEKRLSPTSYWCGFCRTMRPIVLNSDDLLRERFDHIAEHVMKFGQGIEEWLPEYNVHDHTHMNSSIFNGKRGSDVDSMVLGFHRNDPLLESGYYEDYDEREHQHPRPKRARAHEPEKDWNAVPQSAGNESHEWMSDGMIV